LKTEGSGEVPSRELWDDDGVEVEFCGLQELTIKFGET